MRSDEMEALHFRFSCRTQQDELWDVEWSTGCDPAERCGLLGDHVGGWYRVLSSLERCFCGAALAWLPRRTSAQATLLHKHGTAVQTLASLHHTHLQLETMYDLHSAHIALLHSDKGWATSCILNRKYFLKCICWTDTVIPHFSPSPDLSVCPFGVDSSLGCCASF